MKKIYKYKLETTLTQEVEMPRGAQVLCIQTQDEIPCIWALVDPTENTTSRTFEIFGTGWDVPTNSLFDHDGLGPESIEDRRRYVGTYQLRKGELVFHCFEIEK